MWNVVMVALVDQGDIDENPTPAPNASRISVSAAAATPPARIAPQETADRAASGALDSVSNDDGIVVSRSMLFIPGFLQPCVFVPVLKPDEELAPERIAGSKLPLPLEPERTMLWAAQRRCHTAPPRGVGVG